MDGLFEQAHHACREFAGPARSIATLMAGAGIPNLAIGGVCYQLTDRGLVISRAETPTDADGDPNPQRLLPL